MANDPNRILVESTKHLLRRGAASHLTKIVNMAHAADLSAIFTLSSSNQKKLFDLVDDIEKKGFLLMELDEDILLDLVEGMDTDLLVKILQKLPEDDAADLLSALPEEKAGILLKKMKEKGVEDVEDLLRYDEETAGRIMVTDVIALKQDMTVKEAIAHI